MKKSKKIAALVLSAFSFAQPAFQSCYAMFNDEDQSILQLEGKEAKTRKDFLECLQSIISDKSVNTSSAIYGAFKEKAEPFKGLQFDHKPWQELLYIIEDNLESRDHERYLNAKRKSEESGEKLTFDDHLHNELLSYGFTEDEIEIVDKLLNKARDLYLKEKQAILDAKPEFLKCLQSIISDKYINTSSAIYGDFKRKAEPFKDLQSYREDWKRLLCTIEDYLEPMCRELYLYCKRESEKSGESFNLNDYPYLHDEFLSYGYTEDEIEIVDKLLSKSSDLYLKEKKAISDAKLEFLQCLKGIISDENINTSPAIYEAFETRIQRFRKLQPGHAPWQFLLNYIEDDLKPEAHAHYLLVKKESEKSGEPLNYYDKYLHDGFLSYGFTEDEIEIVDELSNKAIDLYLKENLAFDEEARRREEEARQFIVDSIQELLAMENITSKSILGRLKAIAGNEKAAPLRCELDTICEFFCYITNFREEGSIGEITGDAFEKLEALWHKYRKIQAEEKAKKEADKKARK